jgi:lysozyme family protein
VATDNFAACDAFTAHEEGGYTDNPEDPGNWTGGKTGAGGLKGTKYGIAASTHPDLDIINLTPDQAAAIRKPGYWVPVQGDRLPVGVDLMVYDQSVNAGPGRSAIILQSVLGVTQDGGIGPATLAAVATHNVSALITAIATAQEAFYRSLAGFPTFGTGWLARVERRKTAALAMAALA